MPRFFYYLQKEDEFIVYEPYCANYTNATELMLANEQNLIVSTLPSFLSSHAIHFLGSFLTNRHYSPDNIQPGTSDLLTKYMSIAFKPLDQCQGRAARFANQADSTYLQVSSPS